jgi:hypothetical protein
MMFRSIALLFLCAAVAGCGDRAYSPPGSDNHFARDFDDGPGGSDDLSGDDVNAGNSGEPPPGEYNPGWDEHPDGGEDLDTCGDVLKQSAYCLTIEIHGGALYWVGLDDGAICDAGQLPDPEGGQMPGQSLMVVDEVVYICASDENGEPALFEYDLATQRSERFDVSCSSLFPDPRGGFMATPHLGGDGPVGGINRYDSLDALLEGDASSRLDGEYGSHAAMAAYGDFLYTAWHSSQEIEEYDLASGRRLRTIQLDRPDDWIFGFAVLRDRIVLTAPGRLASMSVYDLETGDELAVHDFGLDFGGVHCFEAAR